MLRKASQQAVFPFLPLVNACLLLVVSSKTTNLKNILFLHLPEDVKYRKLLASQPFLVAKNTPKMAVFCAKQYRADSKNHQKWCFIPGRKNLENRQKNRFLLHENHGFWFLRNTLVNSKTVKFRSISYTYHTQ